jgi:M6 family metalloprotease-like protein
MKMSPVGTNQKILVICAKYSDVSSTRLARASDWQSLLTSQVNLFYNQATFNQTNFLFELPPGGPADGWLSFGYAQANADYDRTGQDAINLVDAFVDFRQYNGVLVITNSPNFGGTTKSGSWWRTSEGTETTFMESGVAVGRRQMGLSLVNEWHAHDFGEPYDEAAAVAAHEIGHQLDLPTHYADVHWFPGITRDSISRWDVMGLSPFQQHFLGWAKADRGWLRAASIASVGPPSGRNIDRTVRLAPQETDGSGVRLIKIPFSSASPFIGYVVENRQRVNGDEGLASSGVLVSLVDETPAVVYGMKDLIMDSEPSPGQLLDGAALAPGGVYFDSGRNIRITVLDQTGSDYDVRIEYPLPPMSKPDLMITPWEAPPYTTADIWVDSQRNGWDVYRYADASGHPEGQGDDAWVDHDNRVYARVHNLGPGPATDVRVQMYVNSPPGMGDAGPDWNFIGAIIFPSIPAGGSAQDFVTWRPTVAAHTCIRAMVEVVPGELNTSSHVAQENVSLFDTTRGSPWKPVALKMRVYNPHKHDPTPASFNVRNIPPGWAVEIEPRTLMLPPGGNEWVMFAVYPSGPPGEPSPLEGQYQPGFLAKPTIEALVPYADTFIPIGGVEVWTHLVTATKLTCTAKRQAHTVNVSGALTPPVEDAVIAVEYTDSKERFIQTTRTGKGGKYSAVIQVPGVEKAQVQAFFDGDAVHGGSASRVVKI